MKLFEYQKANPSEKIKMLENVASILFGFVIALLMICGALLISLNILTNGEY